MEAIVEEINSKKTLNSIKEFRGILVDCAKNIKSNDATFGIATLEEVTPNLDALMAKYIDTVQKLEVSERVFMQLYEELEEKSREPYDEQDNNDPDAGLEDLSVWEQRFRSLLDQDAEVTDQIDAHVDLDQVLRPHQPRPSRQEEDIVVESGQREIPKDPISRRPIKIAMKSKRCHHIYDKTSIESYFEQKEKAKAKVRCPVAGCKSKDMKRSELVIDDETNALIESILNSN